MKKTPLCMLGLWIISTMAWWGFAFAPFGTKAPDWFLSAKNACFGTMANGLPDASGWLLLTLGPLSFLIGLWIAWREEIAETLRWLFSVRWGRALVSSLVLVAGVEAYFVSREIWIGLSIANFNFSNDSQDDLPLEYPRVRVPAPEFSLVDQVGQQLDLSDLHGEIVVLTFAFAHCSTVCPTLVYQAKQGFLEAGTSGVRFLVITLDPWRDRPSTLPTLAKKWKLPERAHVLSGEVQAVNESIKDYGITTSRDEATGDIVHPSMIFVIDQEGLLAYTFNNAPSKWIAQAIGRLRDIGLASN